MQTKGKKLGHSCLPFGKAGLRYLYVKSKSIAIQCMLLYEGKVRNPMKRGFCQQMTAQCHKQKESSIQIESSK